jgi:hypothetical protein
MRPELRQNSPALIELWQKSVEYAAQCSGARVTPSLLRPFSRFLRLWHRSASAQTKYWDIEPERLAGKSGLSGLLDFTGAEAGSAHPQTASSAIHQGAYALQVHIPAALRDIVRVADPASELRTLATHIAYSSHTSISSSKRISIIASAPTPDQSNLHLAASARCRGDIILEAFRPHR